MPSTIPFGPDPGRPSSGKAPDEAREQPVTAADVLAWFAPDGSFIVQVRATGRDESLRLDVDAAGRYALLRVRGRAWHEAQLDVLRRVREATVALAVRTARSIDGGAVEARASETEPTGARLLRELRIEPGGAWRSSYEERRSGGARIVGEATGEVGPGARSRMTRRKLAASGDEVWALEAETGPLGDAGRPTMVTTSRVSYAGGGTGTYRVLSYEEKSGGTTIGQGGWQLAPSGPGSSAWQKTTTNPDGSKSVTTITNYGNGGFESSTETSKTTVGPDGTTAGTSETWTVQTGPSGGRIVTHEKHETATGPGGGIVSWEKTTSGLDGKTTTERGVTVIHGGLAESTTTVVHHPDGSVTITTTTTDPYGRGTRHTTVTDKNGNTISDTTQPVGNPPPQPSDDDSDDDDSDDDDSDDDDSDDDDDDDDADDDDGGDDDGGDDGDDDGMGWDGADEGPPDIMPSRPASILDILADPTRYPVSESDDPIGDRIAQALRHSAVVIPTHVGDTGWGEATGSESLPEITLTPGSILTLSRVPTPTEDWGDWNDPRVHVAYAARLMDALAHSGSLDLAAVTRAARTVEHLGMLVARATGSTER